LLCTQIIYGTFEDKINFGLADVNAKVVDFIANHTFAATGFPDYKSNTSLGGPIRQDNTLMMEVKADSAFYLKGRTFDNYMGTNWHTDTDSFSRTYIRNNTVNLYDKGIWQAGYIFANDYNFYKSVNPLVRTDYQNYFSYSEAPIQYKELSITLKAGFSNNIYAPINSISVTSILALNDYKTVYNDFVSKAPLPKNTNYTAVYPHFDYNVPNIKRLLADDGSIYNSMIQNSANRNYVSQVLLYNAENRALFTKLGSTVTQRTKELALSITKNCKTGYEKVDAIKAYLSKNYIYTLNTTPLPKGADLVDEFLFKSKKGYCVHFASSMVILLRACNVPARYVEGYVSPTASVNGLYKITSSQAHAWVEVYSNILGFYTVEATPGFSYVGSAQGQVDSAVSSVSSSQANS
jgi:transglutaminase-like putative cysteine protease